MKRLRGRDPIGDGQTDPRGLDHHEKHPGFSEKRGSCADPGRIPGKYKKHRRVSINRGENASPSAHLAVFPVGPRLSDIRRFFP